MLERLKQIHEMIRVGDIETAYKELGYLIEDVQINGKDYFFALAEEISEPYESGWWIVRRDFYEENGCVDDHDIDLDLPDFTQNQESLFLTNLFEDEAREYLKRIGMEEIRL